MAETHVTLDPATLLDNLGDRQVEFSGDASGDRYAFAVQYDVLEALAGRIPDEDALAITLMHRDAIEQAAGQALARFDGIGRTIVSGNDLDQPAAGMREPLNG